MTEIEHVREIDELIKEAQKDCALNMLQQMDTYEPTTALSITVDAWDELVHRVKPEGWQRMFGDRSIKDLSLDEKLNLFPEDSKFSLGNFAQAVRFAYGVGRRVR